MIYIICHISLHTLDQYFWLTPLYVAAIAKLRYRNRDKLSSKNLSVKLIKFNMTTICSGYERNNKKKIFIYQEKYPKQGSLCKFFHKMPHKRRRELFKWTFYLTPQNQRRWVKLGGRSLAHPRLLVASAEASLDLSRENRRFSSSLCCLIIIFVWFPESSRIVFVQPTILS